MTDALKFEYDLAIFLLGKLKVNKYCFSITELELAQATDPRLQLM